MPFYSGYRHYTLSHHENDSDVTARAQGYTLQDASSIPVFLFERVRKHTSCTLWHASSSRIRADVTIALEVIQSIYVTVHYYYYRYCTLPDPSGLQYTYQFQLPEWIQKNSVQFSPMPVFFCIFFFISEYARLLALLFHLHTNIITSHVIWPISILYLIIRPQFSCQISNNTKFSTANLAANSKAIERYDPIFTQIPRENIPKMSVIYFLKHLHAS